MCQLLATGRWFSPGTPISSTNKTNCHDIAEMLLKVTLHLIHQEKIILQPYFLSNCFCRRIFKHNSCKFGQNLRNGVRVVGFCLHLANQKQIISGVHVVWPIGTNWAFPRGACIRHSYYFQMKKWFKAKRFLYVAQWERVLIGYHSHSSHQIRTK